MYEHFNIDLEGYSFEWDDEKDKINFFKHGIHFKTAAKVFLDYNSLIREDTEHSSKEIRYNVLGKVGKIIFVVCVFKEGKVIRLISARLANASEKERYMYDQDQY